MQNLELHTKDISKAEIIKSQDSYTSGPKTSVVDVHDSQSKINEIHKRFENLVENTSKWDENTFQTANFNQSPENKEEADDKQKLPVDVSSDQFSEMFRYLNSRMNTLENQNLTIISMLKKIQNQISENADDDDNKHPTRIAALEDSNRRYEFNPTLRSLHSENKTNISNVQTVNKGLFPDITTQTLSASEEKKSKMSPNREDRSDNGIQLCYLRRGYIFLYVVCKQSSKTSRSISKRC